MGHLRAQAVLIKIFGQRGGFEQKLQLTDRAAGAECTITIKRKGLHRANFHLQSTAESDGGGRGIRTLETREGLPLFESGAFDHSAIPPCGPTILWSKIITA